MDKPNEVICKIRKRQHQNPLFGHIGDEISKNKEKKIHRVLTRLEIQFNSKFVTKLSLPYPFFLECLHPIIVITMCIVAIHVF
jgi:hypothetical protein